MPDPNAKDTKWQRVHGIDGWERTLMGCSITLSCYASVGYQVFFIMYGEVVTLDVAGWSISEKYAKACATKTVTKFFDRLHQSHQAYAAKEILALQNQHTEAS